MTDTTMREARIAVLSDAHGNIWALRAVLADVARRGIRRIVNLGDNLYGPLAPLETAELLLQYDWPTVRGNEDRIIVSAPDPAADSPTLQYVRNSLKQEHLDWLASLELTTVAFEHVRMFHGSPDRDDEYLLCDVTPNGVRPKDAEKLLSQLAGIEQPVVLCGHDHCPQMVRLPDGRLVVNPGSVGLPAYFDDLPRPHVMETGSPHARYSVLSHCPDGWQAEHVTVAYDWESAAATACKNGRPDWACWLRSGCAGD